MNIPIYMVQVEWWGIPDCPEVFTDEKKADEYFISMVNDNLDVECKTLEHAEKVMGDKWGCNDFGIRYFVNEIEMKLR